MTRADHIRSVTADLKSVRRELASGVYAPLDSDYRAQLVDADCRLTQQLHLLVVESMGLTAKAVEAA